MKTPARATLDRDLGAINDGLMRMGDLVDAAIEQAVRALPSGDTMLAQQIVDGDACVNDLRFDIEEACLSLIATAAADRRRPAGRDGGLQHRHRS